MNFNLIGLIKQASNAIFANKGKEEALKEWAQDKFVKETKEGVTYDFDWAEIKKEGQSIEMTDKQIDNVIEKLKKVSSLKVEAGKQIVKIYYKDHVEMRGTGITKVEIDGEQETADRFFESLLENISADLPEFSDEDVHIYVGNLTLWTYDIMFDAQPEVDLDKYEKWLDENYKIEFIKETETSLKQSWLETEEAVGPDTEYAAIRFPEEVSQGLVFRLPKDFAYNKKDPQAGHEVTVQLSYPETAEILRLNDDGTINIKIKYNGDIVKNLNPKELKASLEIEASAYTDFVKSYYKEHEGAKPGDKKTMQEIGKAWKAWKIKHPKKKAWLSNKAYGKFQIGDQVIDDNNDIGYVSEVNTNNTYDIEYTKLDNLKRIETVPEDELKKVESRLTKADYEEFPTYFTGNDLHLTLSAESVPDKINDIEQTIWDSDNQQATDEWDREAEKVLDLAGKEYWEEAFKNDPRVEEIVSFGIELMKRYNIPYPKRKGSFNKEAATKSIDEMSKDEAKELWKSYGGDFDKCVKKAGSWAKSPESYCAALAKKATGKTPKELAACPECGLNIEASAYTDFVSKYFKSHPGAKFKDIAKAWRAGKKPSKKEAPKEKAPEKEEKKAWLTKADVDDIPSAITRDTLHLDADKEKARKREEFGFLPIYEIGDKVEDMYSKPGRKGKILEFSSEGTVLIKWDNGEKSYQDMGDIKKASLHLDADDELKIGDKVEWKEDVSQLHDIADMQEYCGKVLSIKPGRGMSPIVEVKLEDSGEIVDVERNFLHKVKASLNKKAYHPSWEDYKYSKDPKEVELYNKIKEQATKAMDDIVKILQAKNLVVKRVSFKKVIVEQKDLFDGFLTIEVHDMASKISDEFDENAEPMISMDSIVVPKGETDRRKWKGDVASAMSISEFEKKLDEQLEYVQSVTKESPMHRWMEKASLNKEAKIKKLPNGKYRVMAETGRNMGTYDTEKEAKERLQQIEMFKHMKKKKSWLSKKALDRTEWDLINEAVADVIANFKKITKIEPWKTIDPKGQFYQEVVNKTYPTIIEYLKKNFPDIIEDGKIKYEEFLYRMDEELMSYADQAVEMYKQEHGIYPEPALLRKQAFIPGKEALVVLEDFNKDQKQIYPDAADTGIVTKDKEGTYQEVDAKIQKALDELLEIYKADISEYTGGKHWEIFIPVEEDGKYLAGYYVSVSKNTDKARGIEFFSIDIMHERRENVNVNDFYKKTAWLKKAANDYSKAEKSKNKIIEQLQQRANTKGIRENWGDKELRQYQDWLETLNLTYAEKSSLYVALSQALSSMTETKASLKHKADDELSAEDKTVIAKGKEILEKMKKENVDILDIDAYEPTGDIMMLVGEGIADAINSHGKNFFEWDIKMGKINIPDEVRTKINDDKLNRIYQDEAQLNVKTLGDEIVDGYSWAEDWYQEGRMGGWFCIEADFNELVSDINSYQIFVDDLEKAVEDKDITTVQKYLDKDIKEAIILSEKISKQIKAIEDNLTEINSDVEAMLKGFKEEMESVKFWKEYYDEETKSSLKKEAAAMDDAKEAVDEILEGMKSIPLHQGTCDVTEIMNFHEIAEGAGLTEEEYDNLIDYAQGKLNKKIKKIYYSSLNKSAEKGEYYLSKGYDIYEDDDGNTIYFDSHEDAKRYMADNELIGWSITREGFPSESSLNKKAKKVHMIKDLNVECTVVDELGNGKKKQCEYIDPITKKLRKTWFPSEMISYIEIDENKPPIEKASLEKKADKLQIGDKVFVKPGNYKVIQYSTTDEPVYSNEIRNIEKEEIGFIKEILLNDLINIELKEDGTIIESAEGLFVKASKHQLDYLYEGDKVVLLKNIKNKKKDDVGEIEDVHEGSEPDYDIYNVKFPDGTILEDLEISKDFKDASGKQASLKKEAALTSNEKSSILTLADAAEKAGLIAMEEIVEFVLGGLSEETKEKIADHEYKMISDLIKGIPAKSELIIEGADISQLYEESYLKHIKELTDKGMPEDEAIIEALEVVFPELLEQARKQNSEKSVIEHVRKKLHPKAELNMEEISKQLGIPIENIITINIPNCEEYILKEHGLDVLNMLTFRLHASLDETIKQFNMVKEEAETVEALYDKYEHFYSKEK